MRKMWTGPAVVLAGLMLLGGCGSNDVAQKEADPEPRPVEKTVEAEATKAAEPAAEPKVADSDSEPKELESESKEVTMEDFAGYLPDDPIDSVELTETEKMYANFGPPASEEKSIKSSGFLFQTPVRIKGGDEYIKVDQPGYACPTMADLNGDGKEDLIVGQFSQGKMRLFENVSTESDSPKFGEESWIMAGSKPAEVPGVW